MRFGVPVFLCEAAGGTIILFEDIDLDAPNMLINPLLQTLKADLFAGYLAFDSVAGSEWHCDKL